MPGKQARVDADFGSVVLSGMLAQRLEFGVLGQDAEPGFDQAARAGRGVGAQFLERHSRPGRALRAGG